MAKHDELAARLYEAYRKAKPVAVNGTPIPDWAALVANPDRADVVAAWRAVAAEAAAIAMHTLECSTRAVTVAIAVGVDRLIEGAESKYYPDEAERIAARHERRLRLAALEAHVTAGHLGRGA